MIMNNIGVNVSYVNPTAPRIGPSEKGTHGVSKPGRVSKSNLGRMDVGVPLNNEYFLPDDKNGSTSGKQG